MRFVDEFRNPELAKRLLDRIKDLSPARTVNLMEVCGTHTVAIFKHGIKGLLPKEVNLLSGPGCPVCVTPTETIDRAIALARLPNVIFTTFGDMMKVPGSSLSLEEAKAQGRDIRIVYSCLDALEIAKENPKKKIIFFGIGFETTSPSIASTLLKAKKERIKNFFLLSAHKLIPPAMRAILEAKEINLAGFISPGHVSTIIGSRPYEFISEEFGTPCVISGFEPLDVLQSIYMLLLQNRKKKPMVEIQYRRCVEPKGNIKAQKELDKVFQVNDSSWRGLGTIPDSGLSLRKKFSSFDAEKIFDIQIESSSEPKGCLCGEILRGVKMPVECRLFVKECTPQHPIGPCMVSSEGTCATYYRYHRRKGYEKG
jgi:hydrogenase expression/formation protein HypD